MLLLAAAAAAAAALLELDILQADESPTNASTDQLEVEFESLAAAGCGPKASGDEGHSNGKVAGRPENNNSQNNRRQWLAAAQTAFVVCLFTCFCLLPLYQKCSETKSYRVFNLFKTTDFKRNLFNFLKYLFSKILKMMISYLLITNLLEIEKFK